MIAPLRMTRRRASATRSPKTLPLETASASQPTISRVSPQLQERARQLLESPVAAMAHPSFQNRVQAREIVRDDVLGDADRAVRRARKVNLPPEAPAYFAALYEVPLLGPELERRMFRKMNYLKWQAARQVGRLSIDRPDEKLLDTIDALRTEAQAIRDRIISANLRLVVSIARRFSNQGHPFADLVSDGNLMLMNAVEKFDFGRGFRFSTYATLAIQRELVRQLRRSPLDRMRVAEDVLTCAAPEMADEDDGASHLQFASRISHMQKLIDEHLDSRERYVVAARFGINHPEGPQALRSIGASLGISKERVRQLQLRAIETLRHAAEEEDRSDMPASDFPAAPAPQVRAKRSPLVKGAAEG